VSLGDHYARLGNAARLSQTGADEIVATAKPMALVALGRSDALDVVARHVAPEAAPGGSLIPAWPQRRGDRVLIDFVTDWGAMLAAWRSLFDADTSEVDGLLNSGQRLWIGIANDVLQLFVPDPPPGTYSMVRHHALMLVAATLWLGDEATRRWQAAHSLAARAFLDRFAFLDLWSAIERAEQGLSVLLADARSRGSAGAVVDWLDADAEVRTSFQAYLGAASLGVAALLESEPVWTPEVLRRLVREQHMDPDFNREPIERLAMAVRA
jgi:hypothetical protein